MGATRQLHLPFGELSYEDPRFLSEQLITYIGNKRALLRPIQSALQIVRETIDRPLIALDAFSGSGVVSRLLKSYSARLIANDLEPYAAVIANCYLANASSVPLQRIQVLVEEFNQIVERAPSMNGFIERLYASRDDNNIRRGERVFYTRDNARHLDHYAKLIQEIDHSLRPFLLGPLLSAASIHTNTAGVFKGFYKDRATGIGRFGGQGADALTRIKGKIHLRPPILSRYECDYEVLQTDANDLPRLVGPIDIAYLDPPYNQHPYGSNYFMLNLLVNYEEPEGLSKVSGIPRNWRRSDYNVRKKALHRLRDLASTLETRFLLVSFNNEGFIKPSDMLLLLSSLGNITEFKTTYNTFRGSRNLRNRSAHITEYLYLVEKRGPSHG